MHLAGGEELLREAAPGRGRGERLPGVELHVANLVREGEKALHRGELARDRRRGQLAPRFEVPAEVLRVAEGNPLDRFVHVVDELLEVRAVGAAGVLGLAGEPEPHEFGVGRRVLEATRVGRRVQRRRLTAWPQRACGRLACFRSCRQVILRKVACRKVVGHGVRKRVALCCEFTIRVFIVNCKVASYRVQVILLDANVCT